MRLAGEAQLGYYPTPPHIAAILAGAFRAPDDDQPATAFDPFCGTGEAVAAFPAPLTFGVDLDAERIQAASSRLTETLHADAWALKPRPKSVSLLLLNPPYTHDPASHIRQEIRALHTFHPWVHPNGYAVLIAPRTVVLQYQHNINPDWTLRALWRFPDPDYAAFGQVIVILQPRKLRDPENHWDDWLTREAPPARPDGDTMYWDGNTPTWPRPLPATLAPQWTLPVTLGFRLMATRPLPEQILPQLIQSPLWAALQRDTAPPPTLDLTTPIATPLTLHRGHLATLLTAGRLTGAIGTGDQRHLVRGRTIPYSVVTAETEDQRVEETRYRIEITTVHPDGTIRQWHEPPPDAPLMADNEEVL